MIKHCIGTEDASSNCDHQNLPSNAFYLQLKDIVMRKVAVRRVAEALFSSPCKIQEPTTPTNAKGKSTRKARRNFGSFRASNMPATTTRR